MEILPLRSAVLKKGDDIAAALMKQFAFEDDNVVVISSKVIAVTEHGEIPLDVIEVTKRAETLAAECNQNPHFTQLVLNEAERMNGEVAGVSPFALLTSLKPDGMTGRILCPNAGLDQSNTREGTAISWPKDPMVSAKRLRDALQKLSGKKIAVIVGDSCCVMTRRGVTAFALTCAGIDPLKSEVGSKDLFGKKLNITHEAIADQLATAANAVMGNAAQSTPAAVIRNHGMELTEFCGWVPGIPPEEDLYRDLLKE